MSDAARVYKPKQFVIESLDGKKKLDIANNILEIDYFEDILEPSVSLRVKLDSAYSIVSGLPIRGGELVYFDIEVADRDFTRNTSENAFYVYKVAGQQSESVSEVCELLLTTREALVNETARCARRYSGKISTSVKDILTNVLDTANYQSKNIEETANSYNFIGAMKKPFTVLTWLGPKALSGDAGKTDADPNGSLNEKAKGTAGYFFYENQEGFNFKSIDGLVSELKKSEGSSDAKYIPTYSYTGKIIETNNPKNNRRIIKYVFDKNIDLRKALKVGMYSNVTFFYNNYSHEFTVYKYTLKDQIKDKTLSKDKLAVSDTLGDSISRVLVRSSDHGIMSPGGGSPTTGRSPADQAKSLARYNLLFTQALNILIPCNTNLKVGDIINCEFPEMSSGKAKDLDPEISGSYLIRELRHHFSANQTTTSLKLMRDSYGVN